MGTRVLTTLFCIFFSFCFVDSACDDIPSPDSVRKLLKDLRETRQAKARMGVAELDASNVQVNGDLTHCVTSINRIFLTEIFSVRYFLTSRLSFVVLLRW